MAKKKSLPQSANNIPKGGYTKKQKRQILDGVGSKSKRPKKK